MADGNPDFPLVTSAVPCAQIADTRLAFPHSELTFEVELEADDAVSGLGCLADACARSAVSLVSLRCASGGAISCKLADSPHCDFGLLDELVCRSGKVRIVTWTTVIGI